MNFNSLNHITAIGIALALALPATALAAVQDDASRTSERIIVGPDGSVSPEPGPPSPLQKEVDDWTMPVWCGLLDNEEPLVRALVSLTLGEEDQCDAFGGTPDFAAVRRDALLEGQNDPVLLTRVFEADCMSARPAPWCEGQNLLARLIALEPDNAYPPLLAMGALRARNRTADLPFSGTELEFLLTAASASRVDGFYGDGMVLVYDAIAEGLQTLPPLSLSAEAQAEAVAEGFDVGTVAEDMTWSVFFAAQLPYGAGLNLSGGCRAAATSNDDIALAGCTRLGELLVREGLSGMATVAGRDLLRIARSANGEDLTTEAAQEAFRFENQVLALGVSCRRPVGLSSPEDLPGPMPSDHFRTFLEDIAVTTESEAFRLAALREFERFPDAYAMNPARCDEIADIDEKTLRELIEANQAAGREGRNELLRAIGEKLDSGVQG